MATILVLGGTAWLGGALARHAHESGHDVTCLARGESGDAPPEVRFVRADRAEPDAYDEVRRQEWDDVLDVSWQPGFVRGAVRAIGDRARHWTYVSSCSAYADDSTPGEDEDAASHEPLDADTATRETYGPAKVACERACLEVLGDRLLIARAGLIGGPGDGSDRFGYWVSRFALAGDGPVLVPDAPDQPSQVIDVRDLAGWLLDAGVRNVGGTYNAVGRRTPLDEVIRGAREAAGHTGDVVPAPEDWLLERDVEPYMGPRSLPLWLPGPELAGHSARADGRASAVGLHRRPLEETMRDALAYERVRGLDRSRRAGLSRTEEVELLEALSVEGRSTGAASW